MNRLAITLLLCVFVSAGCSKDAVETINPQVSPVETVNSQATTETVVDSEAKAEYLNEENSSFRMSEAEYEKFMGETFTSIGVGLNIHVKCFETEEYGKPHTEPWLRTIESLQSSYLSAASSISAFGTSEAPSMYEEIDKEFKKMAIELRNMSVILGDILIEPSKENLEESSAIYKSIANSTIEIETLTKSMDKYNVIQDAFNDYQQNKSNNTMSNDIQTLSFDLTLEEFGIQYEAFLSATNRNLHIQSIDLNDDKKNAQIVINKNIVLNLALDKDSMKVNEILYIGTGDGTPDSGTDITLSMFSIIALIDKSLSAEQRKEILSTLASCTQTQKTETITVNNIQYSANYSEVTGLMFITNIDPNASPAETNDATINKSRVG